jgi:hypothetical protein
VGRPDNIILGCYTSNNVFCRNGIVFGQMNVCDEMRTAFGFYCVTDRSKFSQLVEKLIRDVSILYLILSNQENPI